MSSNFIEKNIFCPEKIAEHTPIGELGLRELAYSTPKRLVFKIFSEV